MSVAVTIRMSIRLALHAAAVFALAAPIPAHAEAPIVVLRSGATVRRFRVDPSHGKVTPRHEFWKAHDEASGEVVAVKIETMGSATATHPGPGFDAEYEAASTSSHPHVVTPIGLGALEHDSDRGVVVFKLDPNAPSGSPQSLGSAYARVADSVHARAVAADRPQDLRAEAKQAARAMSYLVTGIDSGTFGDVARALPANVRPAHAAPGSASLHDTLERGLAGEYASPEELLAKMAPFADGTALVPSRRFITRHWSGKGPVRLDVDASGWVSTRFWNQLGTAVVHFHVRTHELRITEQDSIDSPRLSARSDAAFKRQARGTLFPDRALPIENE